MKYYSWILVCLLVLTSCKKESITASVSIDIEKPAATASSWPDAKKPVNIKATVNSNVELKQYRIAIKSTSDNIELYSHSEDVSGKSISINTDWEHYTEADVPVELSISVTEAGGQTFTEKRMFTRTSIPGYDKKMGLR